MNFFTDILPIVFSLALIVLVMYLSFVFTKYMGKRMNTHSKLKNIKIVEQVALGQERALLIAAICGKFYLIGVSAQSIAILSELDDVNLEQEKGNKVDFSHLLNNFIKSQSKRARMKRMKVQKKNKLHILAVLMLVLLIIAKPDPIFAATDLNVNVNGDGNTLEILFTLTLIMLLPSIVIMTTSFTRIVIVLSFLRNALGLQQTPPNQVLIGIALFLSLFTMSPVISEINTQAYIPYEQNQISQQEFITVASAPLKEFMLKQTKSADLDIRLFGQYRIGGGCLAAADVYGNSCVYYQRIETGVYHRVFTVYPVSDHRHDRLKHIDVHGHDHAAAGNDFPAI
jgi:flagellar biosynthesis protein FliP